MNVRHVVLQWDEYRGEREPTLDETRRAANLLAILLGCRVSVDGCCMAAPQPLPEGLRIEVHGVHTTGDLP